MKAIQLNQALALPYAIRGTNLATMQPGRFSEAFTNYEKALERDPYNADVYLWRAENYLNLGFFEKAEKDLLRCIELEPKKTICIVWLGKTYFYQGRDKVAFEIFDKAITAGSYAMLEVLSVQYAMHNNKPAVRHILALDAHGWNLDNVDTDLRYRLLTDENFDFDNEFKEYQTKFKAKNGQEVKTGSFTLYLFKRYQDMTVNNYRIPWWNQYDKEFLRSPHRKRLIREAGIYQYWRENEFPPQCHAVSDDDFECD